MTDWTTLDYAVADVEGDGQQPPGLVEVAILPITAGVIGGPVSWLVRPAQPITYMATKVHGIRNEDVASSPAFASIAGQVREALGSRALVAHNAHVDISVLRRELRRWEPPEVFDTLKLARRLLPGRASYKLGSLVTALKLDDELPAGLQPHRAAYDVLVTARLFTRLATRPDDGSPLSLEELRGQETGQRAGGTNETAALF